MARSRIPLPDGWFDERRQKQMLDATTADLGLDVRTCNGLENDGILFVRQLLERTPAQLQELPNFGAVTVERIEAVLKKYGFHLKRPDRQAD